MCVCVRLPSSGPTTKIFIPSSCRKEFSICGEKLALLRSRGGSTACSPTATLYCSSSSSIITPSGIALFLSPIYLPTTTEKTTILLGRTMRGSLALLPYRTYVGIMDASSSLLFERRRNYEKSHQPSKKAFNLRAVGNRYSRRWRRAF